RVKILDFGLARLVPSQNASGEEATVTQKTDPGVVLGTAGYMSPEQVRGKTVDHRTDIFAFGTILYEMVTGKQPFRKSTSADTMAAILNEEPSSLSQVTPATPPGMQRVVHRCLEKDPEHRFHSAHDLAFALEALSDSTITAPSSGHAQVDERISRRRGAIGGVALTVLLGVCVVAYFWMRPAHVPRVSNYVQLTHDGQQKYLVGTDGSRLYLGIGSPAYYSAEMSISGGIPTRIPVASPQMAPLGLSPNGSELLVVDGTGDPLKGPLWSTPILGGSPRRLAQTEGQDAAWSPFGTMLAYTNENSLFVAKADGTEAHKLITMENTRFMYSPVWSPDESHLRFNAKGFLWEVGVDGGNLHRVLPGWNSSPNQECCGTWTSDGKYFLFLSRQQIWALPRTTGLLYSDPKPIQLTSSPMDLSSPTPSKDGKKLFVIGSTFRGELTRYDVKSGQFVPFLGGISAEYVAFSKDGQWVTYVSYPEGILWRSKVDGSDRLQLTYPPTYALLPRWSPDGKKIVFYAMSSGKPARFYEVSSQGGSPTELLPDDLGQHVDPNWSSDGSKIIFAGTFHDAASTIRVLDLSTNQVSTVPGSQGLFSPRWSPNGRYIFALPGDSKTIFLFDSQDQKWTDLAVGFVGWPCWSKDGQYIYFLNETADTAVERIRIIDRKVERVANLRNFKGTGYLSTALSLAPDDSPLLLRDTGTSDVYALDWEEP
ncbi:MAG TPA: protein kinase, partial [Terriglobales bacterium]|nr:protein kinase [Terriglobales bacterium]